MSELFPILVSMYEEFGGNRSKFWNKLCEAGRSDDAVVLSVVTQALRGTWPGGKNKRKLEQLMFAHAGVTTAAELLLKYPVYPSWIVSTNRASAAPLIDLSSLNGAWLLVQYRMTKLSSREIN